MRRLAIASATIAALALTMNEGMAHGGRYRGPPDVVPPGGGNGGGSTPGGGGPTTPGGGSPTSPGGGGPSTGTGGPGTGGPGGPGGGGSNPTTGGGMEIGEDLTRWKFWWEFNKDPYIDLKRAVHRTKAVTGGDDFWMGPGKVQESRDSQRPTDAQVLTVILPSLKRALDTTEQRDITSSCMVAMAKIGKNHDDFRILDIFRAHLTADDLEIRETAALSIGISQMTEGVSDLIHLATDSAQGRKLCDRAQVDDRTRSFACYGLGLVAYASSDHAVKERVLDTISEQILGNRSISNRNVLVAAINAIGLIKPSDDEQGRALLGKACESLHKYWSLKVGPGEQLIQAHVPPAIAKLLHACDDPTLRDQFKNEYLATLKGKSDIKRSKNQITQSCALALGRLTDPDDADANAISASLLDYFKHGKDQQTRNFCLIAKAQIGGERNRTDLLNALARGKKVMEKPWAALALGVMSHALLETNEVPDPTIGHQLSSMLRETKTPDTQAALAIALGLAKHVDAAPQIRALLDRDKQKDELAGYLCISLALMDDQESLEPIRALVESSVRRPERLRQAAVALGKLGDYRVADLLAEKLSEGSSNLARMSALASALGFIGDRRTVNPLVAMLFDEDLTDLTRAFAAVALGGVADKELLPWNSKIGSNMNYRAAVETLTNQQTGILDIL